jgi:Carboxypeptidase regulatory-like domain
VVPDAPTGSGGRARAGLVVMALTALIFLAGCTGIQPLSFPNPPPTTAATGSTVETLPNNLSSVNEPAVPGATTTVPVKTGPGAAALNGTVLGSNGPVPGATVEADRIVGDAVATAKTTTAADGSWTIAHIQGGRYRVRAWQSPSLTLTSPQIVFLASGQTTSMTLQLTSFTGPSVTSAMTPSSPLIGQLVNLIVQVTNPTVGPDGVLRNPGDSGVSVALSAGRGWKIYNSNPQTSGSDGQVLFEISCIAPGSDPLSAAVDSGPPAPLPSPFCSPPPTTTTSTSTTTTTVPCPAPTSTSTTSKPTGRVVPTSGPPATAPC